MHNAKAPVFDTGDPGRAGGLRQRRSDAQIKDATDWVTLRAQRDDDAAAAAYQQAIDTLAALVAEHLRLEEGEPLDLAAIA